MRPLPQARTISEAATRLSISHGALTEALDELEKQMALRLLLRRRASIGQPA